LYREEKGETQGLILVGHHDVLLMVWMKATGSSRSVCYLQDTS